MADQLTDSEAKMLRERVKKYESFAIGAFGAESARVTPADCMASLSELLLAAKHRLALIAYAQIGATRHEIGDAIRKADLGDLFEVK